MKLHASGGGQILWLWTFIKLLDGKCYPAPGAGKESRGGGRQSLKAQANGSGVQHEHDDDVKQGKMARTESAAPTTVSRQIASVVSPTIVLLRYWGNSVSPGPGICGSRADS
ncbi:MAG: hypothetical protein KBA32_10460 [Propionivibrio sp.]|uniref:hypothetical protein n=1 Tax=Propionivibrio sp. TaxID=2212460 RepID=UPI001B6964DA|nr:hypothetical protein [Propionivibrio sp.]MBP7203610.1 hypothetical protein [Propionivibrio sp.]